MEKMLINQIVSEKLAQYKANGEDKIAYSYAYPINIEFAANTQGTSQVAKISISGSQLFIFDQIYFSADGDFDILLKETATGRELSEQAINSQVFSDVNFTGFQYKGINRFDTPKILSGNSDLSIIIYNKSASANTVKLNFKGVSINNR